MLIKILIIGNNEYLACHVRACFFTLETLLPGLLESLCYVVGSTCHWCGLGLLRPLVSSLHSKQWQ